MPDEDSDPFEWKGRLRRGNGTDDRDTHTLKVSGETIGELEENMDQAIDLLERKAGRFREIQPDEERPDQERSLSQYNGGKPK